MEPSASATPRARAEPGRGDLLRTLAAATSAVVGSAYLRSLCRHVAEAFDAELVFVAENLDDPPTRARIAAAWARGGVELREGHDFVIAGTPCERLAGRDLVALSEGVTTAYPADRIVSGHGLDSYVAVAIRGAAGRRIGHLGIACSRPLEPGDEELAVLQVFAARAGAEVERRAHEAALREREADAAALRTRVLEAADEERRRIGRDLHDGAQQRLVVLGQCLDLAQRRLADGHPDAAAGLVDEAREQARATGAELRALARGLHPAGLSEYGLRGALADLARRTPLPVEIGALPARRLPDVVELTLYSLVAEGVTNAVKYAGASRVRVAIERVGPALVAEVADDGRGGADAAGGSGLRGLADRLGALGGSLEVESPAGGGTCLRARLPVTLWRTAREPFLEFGHPGDEGAGERIIGRILAGEKTATLSIAREWELEGGLPRIGQRLPLLDHHGRRRGCVAVTRAAIVPFGEIDASIIAASDPGRENEPAAWRAAKRADFDGYREHLAALLDEPGWRIADEEPMAVLFFRLVEDDEG